MEWRYTAAQTEITNEKYSRTLPVLQYTAGVKREREREVITNKTTVSLSTVCLLSTIDLSSYILLNLTLRLRVCVLHAHVLMNSAGQDRVVSNMLNVSKHISDYSLTGSTQCLCHLCVCCTIYTVCWCVCVSVWVSVYLLCFCKLISPGSPLSSQWQPECILDSSDTHSHPFLTHTNTDTHSYIHLSSVCFTVSVVKTL